MEIPGDFPLFLTMVFLVSLIWFIISNYHERQLQHVMKKEFKPSYRVNLIAYMESKRLIYYCCPVVIAICLLPLTVRWVSLDVCVR